MVVVVVGEQQFKLGFFINWANEATNEEEDFLRGG